MIEFAILKKEEVKYTFSPLNKITYEEFLDLVNNHDKLTWFEETQHGMRFHRLNDVPKKIIAYINYSSDHSKQFVKCQYSKGVIFVTFENRIVIDSLKDVIIFSDKIESNLWSRKKKKIIDIEFFDKYYLKKDNLNKI